MYNINNMPNGIVKEDISKWGYNTNKFLVEFDPSWNIDINNGNILKNINFSNEIIYKKYGEYTYEEIKTIILDKWSIDEEIVDEIINNIKKNFDKNLYGSLERLTSEICKQFKDNYEENYKNIFKELEELFQNVGLIDVILGEFNNYNKTITLYNKAIEDYASSLGIDYKIVMEQVFIHELFHAFHYKDNDEELVERRDYTSKVIKESLARCFEVDYFLNIKLTLNDKKMNDSCDKIIESIKESWNKYPVYNYPYSGVRYIFKCSKKGENVIEVIKSLFTLSLTDMDNALRKLFKYDINLFYRIKNKVNTKKVYIKKPNNRKDNTKYDYNGKTLLSKGRLVLEVIKKYCDDHKGITYDELKKVFPSSLVNNGKKGLVELECNVSDKDKGLIGGHKRYYTDEPITLENRDVVLVNNQWNKDNIEKFIKHCKSVLNMDICVSK